MAGASENRVNPLRPTPSKPTASRSGPVRIGFIALTDCAPLLVADALGYFDRHGVDVELHREAGWATVREKILYRQLDAAHAVVGLGLSLRLGLYGLNCPAIVPFVFSLNGNVITLSMDLWRRGVRDAASLGKLVRSNPQRLITLGVVARTSSHNFLLRRWLKSGGIDPDRDVRLVVIPPPQMTGTLSAGLIDGYCVSDPWNSQAVAHGIGWCPAISEDLIPGHTDKVFVTTEEFAEKRPDDLASVLKAVYEACAFCDRMENRSQVAEILHASGHLKVDLGILKAALVGPFDDGVRQRDVDSFYIFHRQDANYPSAAKAEWLLDEFLANGLVPASSADLARKEALACYRPDLFEKALHPPPGQARSRPGNSSKSTKTKVKTRHQPAHT